MTYTAKIIPNTTKEDLIRLVEGPLKDTGDKCCTISIHSLRGLPSKQVKSIQHRERYKINFYRNKKSESPFFVLEIREGEDLGVILDYIQRTAPEKMDVLDIQRPTLQC